MMQVNKTKSKHFTDVALVLALALTIHGTDEGVSSTAQRMLDEGHEMSETLVNKLGEIAQSETAVELAEELVAKWEPDQTVMVQVNEPVEGIDPLTSTDVREVEKRVEETKPAVSFGFGKNPSTPAGKKRMLIVG